MMRFAPIILIVILTACAQAPIGMTYANPNCVWRCNVMVVDATGAPMLQTLTPTLAAAGGATSRSDSTTLTDTNTLTSERSGGPALYNR